MEEKSEFDYEDLPEDYLEVLEKVRKEIWLERTEDGTEAKG
jgi:hypothetical protein